MIAWIARSPTPGYGPRGRHFVFVFFWILVSVVFDCGCWGFCFIGFSCYSCSFSLCVFLGFWFLLNRGFYLLCHVIMAPLQKQLWVHTAYNCGSLISTMAAKRF